MKITFLIRSLNYGGAERQLVTLAKGLHKRGYNVLVAVFYPNGSLENELREFGVRVHILNKQGRWEMVGFFRKLVRLLRRENPDILHGYLGVSNICTVALKMFFPRMRMIWGVRSSDMDLKHYDWLTRLSFRVECWLSRFADLIIVNSYAGFEYAAKRGFPRNKMVVIPNGIDTKRFYPDSVRRYKVRNEWGIADNETIIGIVGRLDPMKDHPIFLKAAALFLQARDDVRFVCVGDGQEGYRRELHELGQDLGLADKLIWAGSRDDMEAVYNAFDIISSSSCSEGFPNVLGEAMACGIICIATDVGDSKRIIGDTGLVVPPKNSEMLADAWGKILSFSKDNRKSISIAAKRRIEDLFDKVELENKTNKILVDICRGTTNGK